MPNVVFTVLLALSNLGCSATVYELLAEAGYEQATCNRVRAAAAKVGWVENRAGLIWLTERGKIAVAIEVGLRTKARLRRQRYRTISLHKFERVHRAIAA